MAVLQKQILLNGGGGYDTLSGGSGNDTFYLGHYYRNAGYAVIDDYTNNSNDGGFGSINGYEVDYINLGSGSSYELQQSGFNVIIKYEGTNDWVAQVNNTTIADLQGNFTAV